jgi:uncharacterized protein YdeI (YjbR/CyaY-like superfamily)
MTMPWDPGRANADSGRANADSGRANADSGRAAADPGRAAADPGRAAADPGAAAADPLFFPTPADLRRWLVANHDDASELWVGLYKKGSGRPSVTWPELVDELLCFGWIDGVRKSFSDEAYVIRVTPRRKGSNWSAVNVRRMGELLKAGLVTEAGRAAWAERDASKQPSYSFERERAALGEAYEAEFRRAAAAWSFWERQPPGYRKTMTWWVVSAKREETRLRRLRKLIAASADDRRIT